MQVHWHDQASYHIQANCSKHKFHSADVLNDSLSVNDMDLLFNSRLNASIDLHVKLIKNIIYSRYKFITFKRYNNRNFKNDN